MYLAAFELAAQEGRTDLTPATVVVDEPTTFPTAIPGCPARAASTLEKETCMASGCCCAMAGAMGIGRILEKKRTGVVMHVRAVAGPSARAAARVVVVE